MNNKKNLLILAIALTMPLLYKQLNVAFIYFLVDLDVIFMLPEAVYKHLLEYPFSIDAMFCLFMIMIALPIYLWIRKDNQQKMPDLKAKALTRKGFFVCILFALGAAGIATLWQLVARCLLSDVGVIAESAQSMDKTFASGSTMAAYFWSLLSIAILGPIIEEIIFRGILFSGVNRYVNGVPTVIITGLYFGVWHGELIQVVYTSALGIIIGFSYAMTRNMWYPMLIHLMNNLFSTFPPALENNEMFLITQFVIRLFAIAPMIYVGYKMYKKSSLTNLRIE